MKYIKLFESFGNIDWNKIVDDVCSKYIISDDEGNHVSKDPHKFLSELEKVLKEKNYTTPKEPNRPDTFGGPGGIERILKNAVALNNLAKDKKERPLDRYLMEDILIGKFFNGDEKAAGKSYQEWLLERGKYRKHHDHRGDDVYLIEKIEDMPIWTPEDDIVRNNHWGFYFSYLFGGKYYTSHKEQDKKKSENEEYYKNRAEKKYRDVCDRCSSNANMPWVSSDADYPKGMIKKSEVCKKCNPKGEKPTGMPDFERGYYCPICESPGWKNQVHDSTHYDYEQFLKNIEYWKMILEGDPKNSNAKKQLNFFENGLYKEGQKCKCSFEKLKYAHDRYLQFEDYVSLKNMKKNKLYNWFFAKM